MQRVGEGRGRRFRCCHRLVSRFRCSHRLVSRFRCCHRFVLPLRAGFQKLRCRLSAALLAPYRCLGAVGVGLCRLFLKDGAKIRHFCRASKFRPPIWADFQHRFAQFSAAAVTHGGKQACNNVTL